MSLFAFDSRDAECSHREAGRFIILDRSLVNRELVRRWKAIQCLAYNRWRPVQNPALLGWHWKLSTLLQLLNRPLLRYVRQHPRIDKRNPLRVTCPKSFLLLLLLLRLVQECTNRKTARGLNWRLRTYVLNWHVLPCCEALTIITGQFWSQVGQAADLGSQPHKLAVAGLRTIMSCQRRRRNRFFPHMIQHAYGRFVIIISYVSCVVPTRWGIARQ